MNITIEEYRARLYAALVGFDQNEVAQAVNYYIELIEDADDPAQQMAKLGTPEQLAQRIIADNGWSNTQYAGGGYYGGQPMGGMTAEDYRRSSTSGLAKRILALILTFPFWLTAFILLITLLIVVWSVFIALPAGTLAALFESFRWIGKYFGYAITLIFAGVGLAGLSILLFAPVRAATSGILRGLAGFARFLFGIKKKDGDFDLKSSKNGFSKAALLIGALLFVAGGGISAPLFAKAAKSPEKFSQALGLENYEYEYSDSSNIKVDIKSGASLYIRPSDNGKTYLKGENIKTDSLNILDSGEAGFNYDYAAKNTVHFLSIGNISNPQSAFYLYLPEKEYSSADIKLSLGDIKIESFTANNITAENKCGDIKLTNVKQTGSGNSFTVKCDLGDIKLENCSSESESAQITQRCGSIKLEGGSMDVLKADNDLGDIKLGSLTANALNLTDRCGDIKLTDTSVSGSITCKLDLGDAKLELKGKDYNVVASTDLGDVKVNGRSITEAPAGGKIPVNISNNTGDIKVDFS